MVYVNISIYQSINVNLVQYTVTACLSLKSPDRYNPGEYMNLVYVDRMRTLDDKARMVEVYKKVFKCEPYKQSCHVVITTSKIQVGHSFLKRRKTVNAGCVIQHHSLLHCILKPLGSLMKCIEMNWMAILVSVLLLEFVVQKSLLPVTL